MSEGLKHQLILIEDDESMLETLREYLDQIGYRVLSFKDPVEALKYMGQPEVSRNIIVVTDFALPTMNGLEVVREVQKISHSVPVIIISAVATRSQKKIALQQGIKAFLDKPFPLRSLEEALINCA